MIIYNFDEFIRVIIGVNGDCSDRHVENNLRDNGDDDANVRKNISVVVGGFIFFSLQFFSQNYYGVVVKIEDDELS